MAIRVGTQGRPGGRPFPAQARPASQRLWAYGDPSGSGADLGMIRINRQPFQLRGFAGVVGTGLGRLHSTPRRVSDNALRRVDNGGFGVAGLERGALNHDGWDEIATLDRGNLGIEPIPMQTQQTLPGSQTGPGQQQTTTTTQMTVYARAQFTDGPQAKVGPFTVPLAKLTEGNTFFVMTMDMVKRASTDGKVGPGYPALPGELGAARRIYDSFFYRVSDLTSEKCQTLGTMFVGIPCKQSYKGLSSPTSRPAIFPPMFDGKVAIYRFKHPVTGKDTGVFLNVVTNASGNAVDRFEFIVRTLDKSWWAKLWDWIKELIVAVFNFVGDILRDLAKALCDAGKNFLSGLADVPDGKRQGGQWTDAEMKLLSDAQRMALASGNVYGAAAVTIGKIAAENLCKMFDEAPPPPPPPPPPESGGGGIVIAAVAGAALLFVFLR